MRISRVERVAALLVLGTASAVAAAGTSLLKRYSRYQEMKAAAAFCEDEESATPDLWEDEPASIVPDLWEDKPASIVPDVWEDEPAFTLADA